MPREARNALHGRPVNWGFGLLSEATYMRTYSRAIDDKQERWADTVIRVVEGVMSIRQDWYRNVIGKRWNSKRADETAQALALAIYDMKFLPPGRGLWAMGTDYVFERGSHALNNCGAVEVTDNLAKSARWLMDSLMCGVGVGFTTHTAKLRKFRVPQGEPRTYIVPDTKEGWAESTKRLVQSFERGGRPIEFDYSEVRRAGTPIRGFGGISSGAGPLRTLHKQMTKYLTAYANGEVTQTRLITDVMNAIGNCVVAGNVRRSAELAVGAPGDEEFFNLKNYELYPERAEIGWISNNSVALSERDHFSVLPTIAERVVDNGEPGILNILNIQKYGRIGEKQEDLATAINPCGEIPLESFELCNLVEVFPTRCRPEEFNDVLQLATFYASTVALLRSHNEETNEIVARNRRIGVSVSGIADWLDSTPGTYVFDALNRGYDVVRETNRRLAKEAGVAPSVRVTTVKPSGTVSLLAGVSSGMHHPMGRYVLRRVRMATDSTVANLLREAGVPNEPDAVSSGTHVFEFPLRYGNGRTRSVKNVSIFEQAATVSMLQRGWADNAVSNTLTVQPDEFKHVERVLSLFAPVVKSMSLLPDVDEGAYPQMPLEHLSATDYETRSAALKEVNWDSVHDSDGDAADSAFCTNDSCEVPVR
jgi:ribonucleoside-diphosphate reductase alpha chain